MRIDVERVRIFVSDEVGKCAVPDRSVAAVGLDHEHLVAIDSVDLVIRDVRDVNVQSETTHGAAARPVAVDLLNENILRCVLDCDAFVPVGHLDVVDPYVAATDVDSVQTAFVAATDNHVVCFAVGTSV